VAVYEINQGVHLSVWFWPIFWALASTAAFAHGGGGGHFAVGLPAIASHNTKEFDFF
jgi:hypothetical protein